jgi:hypothetical protein
MDSKEEKMRLRKLYGRTNLQAVAIDDTLKRLVRECQKGELAKIISSYCEPVSGEQRDAE